MSVLDVSKECLYEFQYAYMRAEFGDRCKVLYTDSIMYSVECEDAYERMKRDVARFDTSDYAVVTNSKTAPFFFALIKPINKHLNTYILIIFLLFVLL